MGKLNPWTARLRELVLDGPVPYNRALSQMAVLVPPGRAFRDGERQASWKPKTQRDTEATDSSKKLSQDALITQGAHRLAYQTIWTQIRAGRIARFEEDGEPMLRIGPRPWPGA